MPTEHPTHSKSNARRKRKWNDSEPLRKVMKVVWVGLWEEEGKVVKREWGRKEGW